MATEDQLKALADLQALNEQALARYLENRRQRLGDAWVVDPAPCVVEDLFVVDNRGERAPGAN
jgi:hypothetical protein